MAETDKKEELEKVADRIRNCFECPLSKSRTCAVPGEGDPNTEIIFIGEAPGFNEDREGVPFCGQAGKFLDEMLLEIGLKRADVFITNTIKCRPPENRDPEDSEKEVCRPHLDRQIKVIGPKLVVCLGRHSMSSLMPGAGSISKLHGRAVRRPSGQVYLALYHPAAALHNGSLRKTLIDDFRKIPSILEKLKSSASASRRRDGQASNLKNMEEESNIKQQKLI